MKRALSLLLVLCTLAAPFPTHAGGWGVTTLDAWPQNVVAGKPITVTFVVRQHGIHPTTEIAPMFEFRNGATRESLLCTPKCRRG